MAQSPLLVRPAKQDPDGCVHLITPESAGWTYIGFEVHELKAGQRLARHTGAREACIVVLSGQAQMSASGRDFGLLGARADVFDGPPWSLYVPSDADYSIAAEAPCAIAICTAPGKGGHPARVIAPRDVTEETRGTGSNTRHVRNILSDANAADSLLVVEVLTPAGNWSSYPPHKHDRDALPDESLLEETYYHRLHPRQGYGVQRVYTDDRSLDETISFSDGDVVLVPRGYHPVGAPHGYALYYLNVMAGPKRIWRFHNDPDHAWLLKK